MKYLLEIVNKEGVGISDEKHSFLESDTAIPIPNVGDKIYLPKEMDSSAICVEVVNREFILFFKQNELTAQVQVFCKESKGFH